MTPPWVIVRDTLSAAPAELLVDLGPHFPKNTRIRSRLSEQLSIHQIGDPPFDHAFLASGGEAEALAILDGETRQLLLALDVAVRPETDRVPPGRSRVVRPRGGDHTFVRIGDGRLHLRSAMPLEEREPEVRRLGLALATLLARSHDVPERLLANVRGERLPMLRNRSLRWLVERFPGTEPTRRAAELAVVELSTPMRLVAATALGPAGLCFLRELVDDPHLRPEVRAEALERWIDGLDPAALSEGLEVCLTHAPAGLGDLSRAAARLAGRGVTQATIGRLVQLALLEPAELASPIVEGLTRSGAPLAETALLALLDRAQAPLRRRVIEALREVGTLQAVEPLRQLASARGGEHRALARDAVKAIQGRLSVAGRGALSIAAGGRTDGGALSLASDARGGLSLGAPASPGAVAVSSASPPGSPRPAEGEEAPGAGHRPESEE